MFSAVGWIWVEDAVYPDDFGDPTTAPRLSTIEAVREAVERLRPDAESALFRINAQYTVMIDRHHNHRAAWATELFAEVARVAPGSFGFLHVFDDEHPVDHYRFIKWSMIRGRVSSEEDASLRPVIRDWYDGRHPLDAG